MTEQQAKKFISYYDKFGDAIFRFCLYRVFDRELAKELTQETFLRAWRYFMKDEKVVEKVQSFLYRVARNLIIDHARKKREQSLDQLSEAGFEPKTEQEFSKSDFIENENVRKIIEQLDEPYREVILMRYIDGLSPKEIAELVGESANVISVRISRAKQQLKKLLEQIYVK